MRVPHEAPPLGPRIRWDRDYPYWPVYSLGGCTNHFFGNMPRFHPAHFDQPAFGGGEGPRLFVAGTFANHQIDAPKDSEMEPATLWAVLSAAKAIWRTVSTW